jgi:hypothetical protein
MSQDFTYVEDEHIRGFHYNDEHETLTIDFCMGPIRSYWPVNRLSVNALLKSKNKYEFFKAFIENNNLFPENESSTGHPSSSA